MLPELNSLITDRWPSIFHDKKEIPKIQYLGLPGSIEGGTATFLAFAPKEKYPLFAVKVYRSSDVGPMVRNETEILNILRELGGSLARSVPRVLLAERVGKTWVVVQSIVEGKPMSAILTSNGLPDIDQAKNNFKLVFNWLADFNQRTAKLSAVDPLVANKYFGQVMNQYQNIFDITETECDFFVQLKLEVEKIPKWRLMHGDFCRHNLLVISSGNGINVIDWTFGSWNSLPLYDLFFFLTTYFLQIRKKYGIDGFIDAFRYTFFNRSSYQTLVARCIFDYCDYHKIDRSLLKVLFPLFLVHQSVLDYERLIRCSKFGVLPRFTVFLASLEEKNYHEALKSQLWNLFLKFYIKNLDKFLIL